jgi:hypothetical protein
MISAEKKKTPLSPRTIVLGLAGAVRKLGAATRMVGGSIAFDVSGPGGGRWRLDLDVAGGACREGDETPAGTTLHATPAAMVAFFLAPQQIPKLCAEGALSVSGETARLRELAARLTQTRSWLDRG